jgi:DNA-binding MarR family transcriptional regulator
MPQWLTEEQMRAWLGVLGVSSLLDRLIDQDLKSRAGLSHVQYEILVRLDAAPDGKMRMTELAGVLFTTKSGLNYQIQQLEKARFARRRPAKTHDARGVCAQISATGRKKLHKTAPQHVALVREHFIDVLTPAQVAALADGLGAVRAHLGGAGDF